MADASLALQKALAARLAAQCPALGGRVFDAVPQKVAHPYLAIGETQVIDDGADCIDGLEIFVTLHVWSRAVGAVEARGLCESVRLALRGWSPDLSESGCDCVDLSWRDARVMRDPDGLTTHGIVTLKALVDMQ
jgi:hypothetical protein